MSLLELLSVALCLAGSAVILTSAIGLMRLPDVLCRTHALGVGMTLGLPVLLTGLWLGLGEREAGWKIIAVVVFLFATLPVSSHLVARLAVEKRLPRAGRDYRPGRDVERRVAAREHERG